MAISRETLRLVEEIRTNLEGILDVRTRRMVQAWVRAWDELLFGFRDAIDDLLTTTGNERWPTRAQVARAVRLQQALEQASRQLDTLTETASEGITRDAERAAGIAAGGQPRLIASQLPAEAGNAGALAVAFDRLDPAALAAIVARSAERITALSRPLSQEATEAMRRELIRGVAVGNNPRETARRMLRRVEGAFNGGLTRALVISRTETLDAHRQAAAESQQANADVLTGWVWTAHLDARTCPSCWARHGEVFALGEPGPLDHQQGRCARTPKTKSWAELGFTGIEEPPDLTPDARTVFASLPEADQLQIMGARRLELLRSGAVDFADLSMRRSTDGWRDSFAPTPVRDLAA